MPRNIEIKARIDDPQALSERAASLATQGPEYLAQDDTFFVCPNGRLKLRDFGDGHGELIFYQRPDQDGPKTSFYLITRSDEPDKLRETLRHAWGEIGRVRKQRVLYLAGRTRIHLDHVEGLGDFLELEVVLQDDEPISVGEAEAAALLTRLNVAPSQQVAGAYLDLLAAKKERGEP